MPNWVTNKIRSTPEVIKAIVNAEGRVDFNLIAPFPGQWTYDGVFRDAEEMAEIVIGRPVHEHPLIAHLQHESREKANVAQLSDESFEQFIQMLRNHRTCGHLHNMDFARAVWGTKWNACESKVDTEAGTAEFQTAWSCPKPLLMAWSKRFPRDVIYVRYADEDIGSNCGLFQLENGLVLEDDIAPRWDSMSEQLRKHWMVFARDVTGCKQSDDE
jgi:hypothetical protein